MKRPPTIFRRAVFSERKGKYHDATSKEARQGNGQRANSEPIWYNAAYAGHPNPRQRAAALCNPAKSAKVRAYGGNPGLVCALKGFPTEGRPNLEQ